MSAIAELLVLVYISNSMLYVENGPGGNLPEPGSLRFALRLRLKYSTLTSFCGVWSIRVKIIRSGLCCFV